jgi:Matrixin
MGPRTELALQAIKKTKAYGAILAASLIIFGTWASAQNTRELSTAGNAALGPTATDKPPIPKQSITPSPSSSPMTVNWSTSDKPCAHYNDLKKYDLGDIGVKIDVSDPAWAAAFRRALVFWNKVLDVNFHEEKNINACALRITDGPLVMFGGGFTAFAQFADLDGFEAKIVVLPQVPLSPAGKFVNAVHEVGHIVDLRHNPDPKSVMYPFIENSSKPREFANAVQYRISQLLNLRHLKPKPVLCRYIRSVSKARLDKNDLATLSRNHLMREGILPPVKSERAQTEVIGLTRPQAASVR